MTNKNKSQNNGDANESKKPLGKRHDDNKPNTDKNQKGAFNKKDMPDIEDDAQPNDPDKHRIEINDYADETERKIPRMKD